ncbi:hypothetical protein FQN57_005926 [Myotisia sp. PD_48]|nr:hypothetical protein FQN57_005926 [Myotisia sp. PD_48]
MPVSSPIASSPSDTGDFLGSGPDDDDSDDVALKIMTSGVEGTDHEIRIQDEIRRTIKDTSHLVLYIDTFLVRNPGVNTSSSAKQLLKSIESLHNSGFIREAVPLPLNQSAEMVVAADLRECPIVGVSEPSFASDMWSYMCVFAALLFDCSLISYSEWVIASLGPIPEEWKGVLPSRLDSWYDQSRTADFEKHFRRRVKRVLPEAGDIIHDHALSVLKRGLRMLPEEHFTASQLLRDPSFVALVRYCSGA